MTPIVRDGARFHSTLWPYWQCLGCGGCHYLRERIAHAAGCAYNRAP